MVREIEGERALGRGRMGAVMNEVWLHNLWPA